MEDELERLSTAEIVDVIKRKPLKFQSVSLSNVLAQLIRRSVIALQDEKEGACKSEKELSALYDEWLCTWILNVLTSMAISTRTLAGASYFLALSTAGASKHADKFRSKLVDVWGIPKLVALLSYQSVSQEEPQQNLCIDTLLCLCDSDLPGMFYELQHNGLVNHSLDWIQSTTSERVCKKARL